MPRKGKVPAQLRPFLFTKGRRGGSETRRARREKIMPRKSRGRFRRAARSAGRRVRRAFRRKTPEKGIIPNVLYADAALGLATGDHGPGGISPIAHGLYAVQAAQAKDFGAVDYNVRMIQKSIAANAFSGDVLAPLAEGIILDKASTALGVRRYTKVKGKWSWI